MFNLLDFPLRLMSPPLKSKHFQSFKVNIVIKKSSLQAKAVPLFSHTKIKAIDFITPSSLTLLHSVSNQYDIMAGYLCGTTSTSSFSSVMQLVVVEDLQ